MYINIQNTSGTEVVNNNIIEKLYNVLYGGDEPEYNELVVDNNSNIQGNLNVSILYKYKYDLLTSDFNRLFISYNDQYLYIKDPYVKQVLLDNNFGDDFGVYYSIAQSTTSVPKFGGTSSAYNNEIVSFDELQYFRNVTTLTDTFMYVGSQFESVDLRNITKLSRAFYWCGIHNCKNSNNVESISSQCFELATELIEFDAASLKNITWQSIKSTKLTELNFGGYEDIQFKDTVNIIDNRLLTTITGLQNMTKMPGNGAFRGNEALTALDLSNVTGNISDSLFSGCKSITRIDLPLASGTIGNSAFSGCNNLETLNINYTNITSIGESAFNRCYLLTSFNLPICISISNNAFGNCTSLSSISIPSCTSLGREVFIGCTSLTSIDIRSVNNFNYGLFNGCKNLTTVTGIENILSTFVGHRMFYQCYDLILPETLNINSEHLGYDAFTGCKNVRKVKLGTNVKTFYNAPFGDCVNLTEVQGLENIIRIGAYMFNNCENLEGIINLCNLEGYCTDDRIYNIVQGGSAAIFNNCKKITKVIFGHIPDLSANDFSGDRHSFHNCLLLHTVDITSINEFYITNNTFFLGCPNITNVVLRCTTVPTLRLSERLSNFTWSKFTSNADCKIYVPDEAINDYKSAENWSIIADHIFPLSEYVPIVD